MLLRKLIIGVAFAAVTSVAVTSAAIGGARPDSVTTSQLMPGVTYTREVDFTSRGPIVLDVVTAPKPDGQLYSLAPGLSNGALRGKEELTHVEGRAAHGATTVAIDADYFNRVTGEPSGILMQNGVLENSPAVGRSSLGIAADGTLTTGFVSFAGLWQGKGQRRAMSLNTPAGSGKFTLYTPVYGGATPAESGVAVEVVIGTLPSAELGTPLDGTVTAVMNAGPTTIPPGGAVLVARGRPSTAQLKTDAPVGQNVEVDLSLSPDWSSLASAIGGGPLLVRDGKPVFQAGEAFTARQLNSRQARGAIGQLADGRIVLVSVEGTNPVYSIGMSNYELAVELSSLGATTAFGLGAGPAAGLAFDGRLLTRPSGRVAAKISDALVLSYTGIYAAPPSIPVLSPNGDGVGDSEAFSYRVARTSQVVATLDGPGGAEIALGSGTVSPGLHTLGWNGTDNGSPAPEGKWTLTVTGTDEQSVTTTAQRTFLLDDTLSSLVLSLGAHGLPTATFQLSRAANVLVQIQRPNGVPVATLHSGSRPAGPQHVTWNGKIGKRRAPGGHYQVFVQATSSVGTSSLAAPFSLPPHKRQ